MYHGLSQTGCGSDMHPKNSSAVLVWMTRLVEAIGATKSQLNGMESALRNSLTRKDRVRGTGYDGTSRCHSA